MPERQRDIVCRVSISDANSVHFGARQADTVGEVRERERGTNEPLYSAFVIILPPPVHKHALRICDARPLYDRKQMQ